MRPIKLTIKGLNSFTKEQSVDFERLSSKGFFGIFGPTGSGKSTILDAMTLALYGMKAVARGSSDFVNKTCQSAMVSFTFQIGGSSIRRYRVDREFKAALAGAKASKCRLLELTEDENVLEDTVTGVDRACREIIGLTADDFMRTVVLPQGKFSEFLRVNGKDRREILERLFRLEEYGKSLEDKIAEALRTELITNTGLSGQLKAYEWASDDLLKKQRDELEVAEAQFIIKTKRYQKLNETCMEYSEIWKLQEEQDQYVLRQTQLLAVEAEIMKKRKQLESSEQTRGIAPLLNAYRIQKAEDERLEDEMDFKLESVKDAKHFLAQTESAFEQIKKEKENREEVLRIQKQNAEEAVRQWDMLPEWEEKKQILEQTYINQSKRLEQAIFELEELKKSQSILQEDLETAQKRTASFVVDSDDREAVASGAELEKTYIASTERIRQCKIKQEQWETKHSQLASEIVKQQLSIHQIQAECNELEISLKGDNETLGQMSAARLQAQLEDGKPCPVCGSLHHSARANAENRMDAHELLESKQLAEEIQEKELRWEKQKQLLRELELDTARKEALGISLEGQIATNKQELERELAEEAKQKKMLTDKRYAMQVTDFRLEMIQIQKKDKDRQEAEHELSNKREAVQHSLRISEELREKTEKQNVALTELKLQLVPVDTRLTQMLEAIELRVGKGNNPKQVFDRLSREWDALEVDYRQKESLWKTATDKSQKKQAELDMVIGQRDGSKAALSSSQTELNLQLQRYGFLTIEEAKTAMLEETELLSIKQEVKTYQEDWNSVHTALASTQEKLHGRQISGKDKEEKEAKLMEGRSQLELENEMLGEKKQIIKTLIESLNKQKELTKQQEALNHKISILNDLKSVTRGKRFVEFMAVERLKYISKSASMRLLEITNGTYELGINGEGEFVIRDNKNGGALRSPATLSGGETFVTSLALALALSGEIQLKGTAPLELFFLDEGFGALDDTLLDIVMDSLEHIHHEHLKIGIISHVESVKQRVPVRLLVTPAEAGVGGSRVILDD